MLEQLMMVGVLVDDTFVKGQETNDNQYEDTVQRGVVALQARARGHSARQKMVSELIQDRRQQRLQKRASRNLRGKLTNVAALGDELLRQQDALAVCARERDAARRKMRGVEKRCHDMEEELDDARQAAARAEERFEHIEGKLHAAEATLAGCDEMLVEKDKKMAMLESQLSEMQANHRAGLDRGSPRRSPLLRRGTGMGGGVGRPSPPNAAAVTVAAVQRELDNKKIEVERLSAKLEQSEQIINQLIQANSGGGGGGGRSGKRHDRAHSLEVASLSVSQSSPILPHHHHRRALLMRLQQEQHEPHLF